MTPENKLQFKHYEELEEARRALELEQEQLRPLLLEIMTKEKTDQIKSDIGTFSKGAKKAWVYLPIVKTQEDALKTMKLEQQRTGLAKFTETEYLIYRSKE